MMLKPFSSGDAEAAAALHLDCFPDPWPASAFMTLLQTGATGFTIGEKSSDIIAGLILYRAAADEAEILTFAVAPAMRGRGLGMRLLLQSIAELQARGIARFLLEVAKDNQPALTLYNRAGFEIVGDRAGYYATGGESVDAWIMSKDIQVKS